MQPATQSRSWAHAFSAIKYASVSQSSVSVPSQFPYTLSTLPTQQHAGCNRDQRKLQFAYMFDVCFIQQKFFYFKIFLADGWDVLCWAIQNPRNILDSF